MRGLRVHDAPIRAFTIGRFPRVRFNAHRVLSAARSDRRLCTLLRTTTAAHNPLRGSSRGALTTRMDLRPQQRLALWPSVGLAVRGPWHGPGRGWCAASSASRLPSFRKSAGAAKRRDVRPAGQFKGNRLFHLAPVKATAHSSRDHPPFPILRLPDSSMGTGESSKDQCGRAATAGGRRGLRKCSPIVSSGPAVLILRRKRRERAERGWFHCPLPNDTSLQKL